MILLHIHITLQILDYANEVISSSVTLKTTKDLNVVFGVLNCIHNQNDLIL